MAAGASHLQSRVRGAAAAAQHHQLQLLPRSPCRQAAGSLGRARQLAHAATARAAQAVRQRPRCRTSSAAAPMAAPTQQEQQQPSAVHTDALVVGGGPAGLAAAIMLASHGLRVTVAEKADDVTQTDPDKAYVYAIDGRGRQFTDRHGLTPGVEAAGVDTKEVMITRVAPSGKASSSKQNIKDERHVMHWLPRSAFMKVMAGAASQGPAAANITLATGTSVSSVCRSAEGQLQVELQDAAGSSRVVQPQLLVGCDGISSLVRSTLQAWAAEDAGSSSSSAGSASSAGSSSDGDGDRFGMQLLPSLSTGLRFKVLQLPPAPAMRGGSVLHNPSFCLLVGRSAPAIGGAPLRLGLLPIADESAGRTANLITMPDHPVWDVTDAESMYAVFEQAFPQADWRSLVPEPVMARFAASRGGTFPAPQHSKGMAMVTAAPAPDDSSSSSSGGGSSEGKGTGSMRLRGSGVVLLGDAAHCFPPDLGQGVNSALEDVCVLEQQLADAGGNLAQALPAFEAQRLPDSAALAKLVQIGYPLQYNQRPLLRSLWMAGFLAHMVAHKLLPFLISAPLFILIQDPAQRYSAILAATQRSRAVLAGLGGMLVAGVAWLLLRGGMAAAGAA